MALRIDRFSEIIRVQTGLKPSQANTSPVSLSATLCYSLLVVSIPIRKAWERSQEEGLGAESRGNGVERKGSRKKTESRRSPNSSRHVNYVPFSFFIFFLPYLHSPIFLFFFSFPTITSKNYPVSVPLILCSLILSSYLNILYVSSDRLLFSERERERWRF